MARLDFNDSPGAARNRRRLHAIRLGELEQLNEMARRAERARERRAGKAPAR